MHHLTVPRRHAQVPHRIRLAGAIVAGLLVAGAVRAQPSPPWSPDAGGRHDLALLADEADLALPLTQWPLPRAAVQRALAALPAQLSPALEAARARVQRQLAEAAGSQLSIGVRNNLDEALGGFADETGPGSWVALRSSTLESPHLALQVGGRIFADPRNGHGSTFRLDDTAVATEAFGVQLQAWTHRNWWGPGWNSSLVLGDNAPQLSGIGLQRAAAGTSPSRWLSWLGPWNAEFFIAQTENDVQSFLIGTRLTVKPWHWLELGFTRNLQWGGEGHPQSFSSLIDALLGRGNNVDPTQADTDNSSGIGGFDVRLRCPGGLRCAASLQVMGEDAGGRSPTQRLGLIGLEGWSADGTQRVMFEYANTTCGAVGLNEDPNKGCAYRNHAYPEGYTHAARWLGASVGPDSELLSLGWLDAASDTRVRVHGGRVGSRIGRFSAETNDPTYSGSLTGADLRQGFAWGGGRLEAELDWVRVRALEGTRTDTRAGLSWRTSLDAPLQSAAERSAAWPAWLSGTALLLGSALLDRPLDEYAQRHGHNPSSQALQDIGSAWPVAAFGLAGVAWLAQRGSLEGDLSFSAFGAGLSSLIAVQAGKLLFDRARPDENLGPGSFGESSPRSRSSLPSSHSALAWALVTPYAKHYDMPWLYGAAAATQAARVMGRKHWVSDTVAGALIGYHLGNYFYRASGRGVQVTVLPTALWVQVPFD
jgi:membrane-associated phospholipid phosphatase